MVVEVPYLVRMTLYYKMQQLYLHCLVTNVSDHIIVIIIITIIIIIITTVIDVDLN